MFIDILPNLLGPVLVLGHPLHPDRGRVRGDAVVPRASASRRRPPSWGNILSDAQHFYQTSWWYVVFPAAALLITTLAFNLLGDGIRDAMDPRTERLFAARRSARRGKRKAAAR